MSQVRKKLGGRFLVLLDNGKEAYIKHANLKLVLLDTDECCLEKRRLGEEKATVSPADSRNSTSTVNSARSAASRFVPNGAGGTMPRITIPGHTKLLFEEHPGSCKISVGLLRALSPRFQSEPIVALQDRQRNLWLLDPAFDLTIGRSSRCTVVIKENAAAGKTCCKISGVCYCPSIYTIRDCQRYREKLRSKY